MQFLRDFYNLVTWYDLAIFAAVTLVMSTILLSLDIYLQHRRRRKYDMMGDSK